MQQNSFLALFVEVAEICGDKILVLGEVCLLLLSFSLNTLDGFPGIFLDPRIAGIWALNYVDSVFKE